MTYEEKKELYNFHKENCDRIEKERLEQQHNFDSWLLKLCAGSFAVSFAFIEKLVDFSTATFKLFLFAGWLCFSLCLCLSVYAFLNTEKACHFAISQEWQQYKNETEETKTNIKTNYRNIIAIIINKICFFLFFAGVLCLVIFLFINI
nr:MAG TPA: hypothetical protein [Caudoviricetes sp.]